MATASPSIGVIRAQIRAIRNKAPERQGVRHLRARTLDRARRRRSRQRPDCRLPVRLAVADATGPAECSRNGVGHRADDPVGPGEDQRRHPGAVGTAEAAPDQQLGDRPVAVQGQATGPADHTPRIPGRHAAGERRQSGISSLSPAAWWMRIPCGACCWPSGLAFPVRTRTWSNFSGARQNPIWRLDGRPARRSSAARPRPGSPRRPGTRLAPCWAASRASTATKALAIGLVMGVVYHDARRARARQGGRSPRSLRRHDQLADRDRQAVA